MHTRVYCIRCACGYTEHSVHFSHTVYAVYMYTRYACILSYACNSAKTVHSHTPIPRYTSVHAAVYVYTLMMIRLSSASLKSRVAPMYTHTCVYVVRIHVRSPYTRLGQLAAPHCHSFLHARRWRPLSLSRPQVAPSVSSVSGALCLSVSRTQPRLHCRSPSRTAPDGYILGSWQISHEPLSARFRNVQCWQAHASCAAAGDI